MKLVFTNGCFDILHVGHLRLLQQARALGDLLVVGVNSDWSVSQLKGESRPVNRLWDRMEMLRGIRGIDVVIPFHDLTPENLVRAIRPDILVKGPGYSFENAPEARAAAEWGAELVVVQGPPISTTKILERLG
mgnify:CR=1 FL=1